MVSFKSVLFLYYAVLLSITIISINAAPTIKLSTPSSLITMQEIESSTPQSTFQRILSYPKKAASKTFETVGTLLTMIGEGLQPEEAIPDPDADPVAPPSSQYPPEDDNPYLKAASKTESKNINVPKSAASKEEKKGIFEKIGETFENLI